MRYDSKKIFTLITTILLTNVFGIIGCAKEPNKSITAADDMTTPFSSVSPSPAISSPVFIRFKVNAPAGNKFSVVTGGFIHSGEPWVLPNTTTAVAVGAWSEWVDLSKYPWHEKMNRSGGVAEYPSIKMTVTNAETGAPANGCAVSVQLADRPDEKSAVVSFEEKSRSNIIGFLVPIPLRENAKDFESGSQMTARHAKWAQEATGGKPIVLKKIDMLTQLWGHYDPALETEEADTLKSLGFNIIGNLTPSIGREKNLRTYGVTWLYAADSDAVASGWKTYADSVLAGERKTDDGRWKYETATHWVVADEVSAVDFRSIEKSKLNNWFRDFLKYRGVTDQELGKPVAQIEYPAAAMFEKTLPQTAPLETRRLMYYAAKFEHYWSARQLRQISDLIRVTLPGMKTETLIPSHGFLGNAWSAYNIGMSYRNLDVFELGAQESVNQISVEDWIGLNHMYGPEYTWTGGQTFGYYNAIARSAIGDRPILQRGLITPSDDEYLQLKAYSALGQGVKSFFFWTFGPTYIGTENYWSDLKSEYDGIAKLNRTLEKSEDILVQTKPVTDPVGILYSVSHDIWNVNHQAAFVEKRLLWHALRHLQIQPNFLREEDVIAGKLKDYKVLYITDWCVSRKASAAIDEWVKNGGVLYLSAGAATRDEFYEPYIPPFAKTVWEENAARKLNDEQRTYNERTDLPTTKPLTTATVQINDQKFDLPVIGVRQNMRPNQQTFAAFADGGAAGEKIAYGKGQIIAVGFMPMLAYGKSANFKPDTLAEKWTPEPREIVKMALDSAKISPAASADVPVVETDFLSGANGSAVVLANYTYQPIKQLNVDVKLPAGVKIKQAVSTQGNPVQIQQTAEGIRLILPLNSVDIVLLK